METKKLAIEQYLEQLSSSAATPGGGNAAALTGSLAACLVSMVCRLTLGKKDEPYASVHGQMEEIVSQSDKLRDELVDLGDQDCAAFDAVMACYKLPNSSDEEKAARKEQMQAALKNATEVPFHIAERCDKVLELAQEAANKGVRTAVSDAGTSAGLAEAALHSALLNVDINLKYIKDEKYVHLYHKKRVDLAHQAQVRRRAILAIVEDWINPENP